MYDSLPKPSLLLDGGTGWFRGWMICVWLCSDNVLVWTDHNGYDAGVIRNPTQEDVVRVLTEAFLTDLS